MHEATVVRQLIESLDQELARQGAIRATRLRLRRGSAFSEAVLRQAFALYARGTRLEGADLEIETVATRVTCDRCGHQETVTADQVVNHMTTCSQCGALMVVDEAHELAVVDLTVEVP